MISHIPYTYLIGWTNHNSYYYGVRYKQGCHPGDLFVTYFTSSTTVHNNLVKWGFPDIIQIRQTFNDAKKAVKWEARALRRLKILYSDKWLNASVGGAFVFTDEVRHKMSVAKKGKKKSKETCHKMSEYSKNRSEEHRRKLGEATRGKKKRPRTEEHRRKISESNKNPSEETRRKLSEAAKKRVQKQREMGFKVSEETRRKMSESTKKYWERRHQNPDRNISSSP